MCTPMSFATEKRPRSDDSAVAQRESQPTEEFNEMSDPITSMHRDPTPGLTGSREWPRGLADQTAGFDEDRL
jgi:hypothetical protein